MMHTGLAADCEFGVQSLQSEEIPKSNIHNTQVRVSCGGVPFLPIVLGHWELPLHVHCVR